MIGEREKIKPTMLYARQTRGNLAP